MKKIILFLALACATLVSGCMDLAMQYTPSDELSAKYTDQVKDDYLTIYYSVKKAPNGQALIMTIKNTGNVFVQNLNLNYNIAGTANNSYNYQSMGNLKNRASKDLTILLPKDYTDNVKMDYSFTPVIEDAFLNRDAQPGANRMDPIKGTITIYMPK